MSGHCIIGHGSALFAKLHIRFAHFEAMGQKFHIVAPKSMKWKDVLALYVDAIEQMMGKRPEVYLHEDMNMACKVYGNYYQVHYDRLFDRVFDSEKICRLNPALEFTSMQEGLKKCLAGFVEVYKEKNERIFTH